MIKTVVFTSILLCTSLVQAGLFFGPNVRVVEKHYYSTPVTTRVYTSVPTVYVVKPTNAHQRKANRHAAKAAYHQVLSDNKE